MPLSCSDPPSGEIIAKSRQIILANQRIGRSTAVKAADKKISPGATKDESKKIEKQENQPNFFFRTGAIVVIFLLVMVLGLLYLAKRRR